jgi:glycosyltransferase involved in cell wall biosynthesis
MAESRRLRILLASDHYPPFIGGAHRWAELTAHGLAARGHEVCVITGWHGGLPRRERTGDVEVNRIRQLRTVIPPLVTDGREVAMPPFPDPVSLHDARGVIARFAPDAAIAHGWMAASVAPILARRSTPVLLSTHDYGYFCATRTLRHGGSTCSGPAPAKCLSCAGEFYGSRAKGAACVAGVAASREVLLRSVSGIQTVSSFVDEVTWEYVGSRARSPIRRFIISAFVDEDPSAVDTDEAEVARVLNLLPDEPFIMFAGALREIKGVAVLLRAYGLLENPPPLVLMGTVHEDTPRELPPGAIIIENAPHVAVMEGWRRALVGVVPSVWPDPCPTVSIECASQGTPVIGTLPGGMSDTVGDAGILVQMGDAQALADALAAVISDPLLRARLGEAGRQRAAGFTGPLKFAEYEQALFDLLADAAESGSSQGRADVANR